MVYGPIIVGEHAVLHPPAAGDAERIIGWFADTAVTRFLMTRSPYSLRRQDDWLERMANDANAVLWMIASGEVFSTTVGFITIQDIDWQNRHAVGTIVIGDSKHQSKGLGTSALRLRSAYAFAELGLNKLKCHAFVENIPSVKALQRVGYRDSGVKHQELWRENRWHDVWVGELLRGEWEDSAT